MFSKNSSQFIFQSYTYYDLNHYIEQNNHNVCETHCYDNKSSYYEYLLILIY